MITFPKGQDPQSKRHAFDPNSMSDEERRKAEEDFRNNPGRDLPKEYIDSFWSLLRQIEGASGVGKNGLELSRPNGGDPHIDHTELEMYAIEVDVWHEPGWVDCRGDVPEGVAKVLEFRARELLQAAENIRRAFSTVVVVT